MGVQGVDGWLGGHAGSGRGEGAASLSAHT